MPGIAGNELSGEIPHLNRCILASRDEPEIEAAIAKAVEPDHGVDRAEAARADLRRQNRCRSRRDWPLHNARNTEALVKT